MARRVLFNTVQYAWFFAIVFVVSWLLAGKPRSRQVFLLIASYVFYGTWDWRFMGLLFLSTATDYVVGLRMGRVSKERRRGWLLASLFVNLGVLGFFKYFNFFTDSAVRLIESAGFHASVPTLSIVLPVGISFYTFQTMAYTIDVYRGRTEVCRDPIVFGLYVAYFPPLVAGPIERAQNLIPQLFKSPTSFSGTEASKALFLIGIGLIKKVAIGDYLAVNLVDRVFESPSSYSSLEMLTGIYGFAVQIYCDFSGYTDIAIGSAALLGIKLTQNFDSPYKARNVQEYWRRWHISLSNWLRDYLYFPLGGSKHGTYKTYRNLMITMVLGGLWHGAGWNYVIWGFVHGVMLCVTRAWQRFRGGAKPRAHGAWSIAIHVVLVFLTFNFAAITRVFFRPDSFQKSINRLHQLFAFTTYHPNLHKWVLVALIIGLVSHYTPDKLFEWAKDKYAASPWYIQGAILFGVAFVLREAATAEAVRFIYFQF